MRHGTDVERSLGRSAGREEGLIKGYLIGILLFFVVLALAANEAGQIVVAKVRVSNAASAAAQAGAESFLSTRSRPQARVRAQQAATSVDAGIRITAFAVKPDGTITLSLLKTADTLILRHISFLQRFGVQRSTQTAGPPAP